MDDTANTAQIEYWNDKAGHTWARFQDQLDRQVEPLGAAAMAVLAPQPGEKLLDIGCGCGQTSLSLAAAAGPAGAVVGADISRPMLGVARARFVPQGAAPIRFEELDAQTADLGEARFDAAYSRFGVMFFSDPVAAFTNIHRALKPGGRLAFVCWRPFEENIWMCAPFEAVQHLLPPRTPSEPLAPGPFAFADPARVRMVLAAAGFEAIRIDPLDAQAGGLALDDALDLALRVGPLGAALREVPERVKDVAALLRPLLSAYNSPSGVYMPAAVWIVSANKPGF